jgi:PIN domain nuclease of toxin-antitoxin system
MEEKYLLDTHVLIWFQNNNVSNISLQVLDIIQNPANTIYISQISLFEITIKQKIGKLPLFKATIEDIYFQALADGFTYLPISNKHLFKYNKIPLMEQHRDPFDRLLLATSLAENVTLISIDNNFNLYKDQVTVIW